MLRSFALFLSCLSLSSAVHAAPSEGLESALGPAQTEVDAVASRVRALEQRVSAGGSAISPDVAIGRFETALVANMLGNHTAAAERFFVLVESQALEGFGMQAEAEWYLGESLYEIGHDALAEDVLDGIRRTPGHPFRPEAVRVLLQIYARGGQPDAFDELFQAEVLKGDIASTDVILYEVGKAFRFQGDLRRAKSYFSQVPVESPFYARARYQMGASLVQQGDDASLVAAVEIFGEVAGLMPTNETDIKVVDLSRLALGRVHDHRGEYALAIVAYEQVDDESTYLADKLREVTWVYVSAQRWREALAAAQDFLSRFGDHAYTAEMRLIIGHLLFKVGETDQALDSYEAVISAFEPIETRFRELARDAGQDPQGYVEEVIALRESSRMAPEEEQDVGGGITTQAVGDSFGQRGSAIPAFSTDLLLEDVDFRSVVTLYTELKAQREQVETSEALVEELAGPLGDTGALDLTDTVRLGVVRGRADVIAAHLSLFEAEEAWLASAGLDAGTQRGLADDREALAGQVARLVEEIASVTRSLSVETGTSADLDGLESFASDQLPRFDAAVTDLAAERAAARVSVGLGADGQPEVVRLASLHGSLEAASAALARVESAIDEMATAEIEKVVALYRTEAANVREERFALRDAYENAHFVASWLLERNFGRVAEMFSQSIMGADMGVMNVSWSRWVQAGQEREDTRQQRNEVVGELERRYGLIEQKLEQ